MTTPLRIVSVVNCTSTGGLGLNEGLERAMRRADADVYVENEDTTFAVHFVNEELVEPREQRVVAAVAHWFREKFDDHITDADAVEFRFPAGRVNNGGIFPRRQCAKWQKIEGPVWEGFFSFFNGLPAADKSRVQIALPFPTKKRHVVELRRMPTGTTQLALRFEDLGSLGNQFMARVRPLLDAGYRVGADTVPTDQPSTPGTAHGFRLPKGYSAVTWGLRARILKMWIRRYDETGPGLDGWLDQDATPITLIDNPLLPMRKWLGNPYTGLRLSLLLTGAADDVMPVADLERVRPLLHEIRVQNVKDENMKTWIRNQRSGQ